MVSSENVRIWRTPFLKERCIPEEESGGCNKLCFPNKQISIRRGWLRQLDIKEGLQIRKSRTSSFGSPVMIVQVCNHSLVDGSFQPSHRPGKDERSIVFHANCVRDLPSDNLLPLVKGISWN